MITPEILKNLDENVMRGLTYLDLHYVGWVDQIDVNTLDIASSLHCVAGQLKIWVQVNALSRDAKSLETMFAFTHGFFRGPYDMDVYPVLTQLWKQQISLRKEFTTDLDI